MATGTNAISTVGEAWGLLGKTDSSVKAVTLSEAMAMTNTTQSDSETRNVYCIGETQKTTPRSFQHSKTTTTTKRFDNTAISNDCDGTASKCVRYSTLSSNVQTTESTTPPGATAQNAFPVVVAFGATARPYTYKMPKDEVRITFFDDTAAIEVGSLVVKSENYTNSSVFAGATAELTNNVDVKQTAYAYMIPSQFLDENHSYSLKIQNSSFRANSYNTASGLVELYDVPFGSAYVAGWDANGNTFTYWETEEDGTNRPVTTTSAHFAKGTINIISINDNNRKYAIDKGLMTGLTGQFKYWQDPDIGHGGQVYGIDQDDYIFGIAAGSENSIWWEPSEISLNAVRFVADGRQTITFNKVLRGSGASHINLEYSYDGITWNEFYYDWGATSVSQIRNTTVEFGTAEHPHVYVRGTSSTSGNRLLGGAAASSMDASTARGFVFGLSPTVRAYGNVQTLIDYNNPPTTAYAGAFYALFYGCSVLTVAPSLPATTLEQKCYMYMFQGCTQLETPPATLPAATVPVSGYDAMFKGCTSLTYSPTLAGNPSASNANSYREMFSGCSNLNKITSSFSSAPTSGNFGNWVDGVASSGTYKNLSSGWDSTATANIGVNGVPTGWVSNIVASSSNAVAFTVSGTQALSIHSGKTGVKFFYSYEAGDNKVYEPLTLDVSYPFGSSVTGKNTIYVVGSNSGAIGGSSSSNGVQIRMNATPATVTVSGKLMGLISKTAASTMGTANYMFTFLFYNNKAIKNLSNLTLPSNVASYCYSRLFYGCTALTDVPALPATTLKTQCYYRMFYGCTKLVSAPALPATTLASGCYYQMFYGCTALTNAPTLSVMNLVYNCYCNMFYNCKSLVTPPALPATTLASDCYEGMFYGCTSLTSAPTLPATTLEEYCYQNMFYGCTKLTSAPTLAATTLAEYCYDSMFYGCTKLQMTPTLPATTLSPYCYREMFHGCTGITTCNEILATTLAEYCCESMFYGCTGITEAPTLYAPTLVTYCYRQMFSGCSNLNYIDAKFTTSPNENPLSVPTSGWVSGVASTGTFVKSASATWNVVGDDGVPTNWVVLTSGAINNNCLTFESAATGATLKFTKATGKSPTIKCSTDKQIWTDMVSGTAYSFGSSKKIYVCGTGNNSSVGLGDTSTASGSFSYFTVSSTGDVSVYGNVMHLLESSSTPTAHPTSATHLFTKLFSGNTKLKYAGSLNLGTMALTNYCYEGMFQGCTGLTVPPTLGSTTIAANCYEGMFQDCTSLATAPALPATTLKASCYKSMFSGCSALTTMPTLPATSLQQYCYDSMFTGTGLTTVNSLPAVTLQSGCYNQMFKDCSHLNYIDASFTTTPSTSYTSSWVSGVASSGTFVKSASATWNVTGVNGIPTSWMVQIPGADNNCLTFEATSATTIKYTRSATTIDASLYYSTNKSTWTKMAADTSYSFSGSGTSYKLYLRGSNPNGLSTTSGSAQVSLKISGSTTSVSGKLVHLLDYNQTLTSIPTAYCFYRLFYNCTGLKNISGLTLPSSVNNYCYQEMFRGCTGLTTVSDTMLSGISTLATSCYSGMFRGCTKLVTPPALPSTSLAGSCYENMFNGDTSLGSVPSLPAANIPSYAYSGMFSGCTALTSVSNTLLSNITTFLGSNAMMEMFAGCSKLTNCPTITNAALKPGTYMNMFKNCSLLTTVPTSLPATTLDTSCYSGMFMGTKISAAPALPATTLKDYCYSYMFQNCTSLTSSPVLPATTLISHCYDYMFYGCSRLSRIEAKFTTTPSTSYTSNWVYGVASSGTFVKKDGATWNVTGVNGVPTNWVVATDALYALKFSGAGTNSIQISYDEGQNGMSSPFEYSYDGATWSHLGFGSSLTFGDSCSDSSKFVYVRGTADGLGVSYNGSPAGYHFKTSNTANIVVEGDVMSLCLGSNGQPRTSITPGNYTAPNLFKSCKGIKDAGGLELSHVSEYAYSGMFYGCTGLTVAPSIPSTLAAYCCSYMFYGCTSLATAPELPATTLYANCYQYMFYGCTSLTTMPALPATTLTPYCYYQMFRGCTSLINSVSLPATTLVSNCYRYMFYGCSALNAITANFTTTPGTSYTTNWVYGVAATGTFTKNPSATWTAAANTGVNGVPTGWTVIGESSSSSWDATDCVIISSGTDASGSLGAAQFVLYNNKTHSTAEDDVTWSIDNGASYVSLTPVLDETKGELTICTLNILPAAGSTAKNIIIRATVHNSVYYTTSINVTYVAADYVVTSWSQWRELANAVNLKHESSIMSNASNGDGFAGKYILITNDLNANSDTTYTPPGGVEWYPEGNSSSGAWGYDSSGVAFKGTLDGGFHKIYNFQGRQVSYSRLNNNTPSRGLFIGYGYHSTLKNIKIECNTTTTNTDTIQGVCLSRQGIYKNVAIDSSLTVDTSVWTGCGILEWTKDANDWNKMERCWINAKCTKSQGGNTVGADLGDSSLILFSGNFNVGANTVSADRQFFRGQKAARVNDIAVIGRIVASNSGSLATPFNFGTQSSVTKSLTNAYHSTYLYAASRNCDYYCSGTALTKTNCFYDSTNIGKRSATSGSYKSDFTAKTESALKAADLFTSGNWICEGEHYPIPKIIWVKEPKVQALMASGQDAVS